eukprot:8543973-Karenia_brevis.AAC.1
MHHACQYLGLGICWVRENDSLHEALFPCSRPEAVDINDEPHRAWAQYKSLAPAEVAKHIVMMTHNYDDDDDDNDDDGDDDT